MLSESLESESKLDLEKYKLHRRFDRMGRLIGDEKMNLLMKSHVLIVGLGGVGSWAAESVARSGVGRITLVDFDEICITNTNRQLHALSGMVGSIKSDVMAERLKMINPGAKIRSIPKFYNAENCEEIFSDRPDYVIDSIDNLTAKCHLITFCREQGIPLVCSTGTGGRLDPTQIKVADLALTEIDPLAREVRKILRQRFGFPAADGQLFGVPAVYSTEAATAPLELHYDNGEGFRCVCPQGDNPYFQCDSRNLIYGNASFVTGAFGLACASVAIRALVSVSSG